jgi:hypothetical protein
MAKKKNQPAAANLPTPAKPTEPTPAPMSPEELRRHHIVENTKDSIRARITELQNLVKGTLNKKDQLAALALTGEAIMSVALHAGARLRAAQGRTDASLAAKGAFVRTNLRKAEKQAEMFDFELTSWSDVVETLKPVVDACTRTVKDLDLPGMKAAIGCSGEALFDDEGAPAERAAAAAAPAPAPEPPTDRQEPCNCCGQTAVHAEDCVFGGAVGEDVQPATVPSTVQGRELPVLGMAAGPVIDIEPEPTAAHPLDAMSIEEANEAIDNQLEALEEEGVQAGLKRKDWPKASGAWSKVLPTQECDEREQLKRAYDLLACALDRNPITWDVPTDQELFAHQRQLAVAAGE